MTLEGTNLKEIAAQVRVCPLCRLCKTRTHAVPGEGAPRAEVMFIGEGPGYREDKEGRPFVGPAGQFLNELLDIAGLDRDSVFITNVVKCRPPNNRDPLPDEMAACAPYLESQIALIKPRVIVTLGRFSMARFFPGERISQIHGTARVIDGRLCVAMYHPAAGLHQASLADVIRNDFRKLPAFLQQAKLMNETIVEQPAAVLSSVTTESIAAVVENTFVMEEKVAYEPAEVELGQANIPSGETEKEPPQAVTKRRKGKEQKETYKQMSFFDL